MDHENGKTPKIASCSEDKTIRVWDLEKDKCHKVLEGHKEGVLCLMWYDGTTIVSGGKDDKIKL
jgi:WD40 repeat protein